MSSRAFRTVEPLTTADVAALTRLTVIALSPAEACPDNHAPAEADPDNHGPAAVKARGAGAAGNGTGRSPAGPGGEGRHHPFTDLT